jgi:hypothetical protein
VGVGEAGDLPGAVGEVGELADGRREAPAQDLQTLLEQQSVGVVGDEGAGGSQVQDATGPRVHHVRLLGEMSQVGHHVVAGLPLELRHPERVQERRGLAESGDLGFGDGKPELPLALGQDDP